jgi:hypothetical protein
MLKAMSSQRKSPLPDPEPLTQLEVAKRLGLTLDQVRHAEKMGLLKLRMRLLALGLTADLVRDALAPSAARPMMPMDLLVRRLYQNRPFDDDEVCFNDDENY